MTAAEALRAGGRLLGELLVTGGLVVLLFAAYLLWGTNLRTAAAQDDLRAELQRTWAAPAPAGSAAGTAGQAGPSAPAQPQPAVPQPAQPAPAPDPEPLPGDALGLIRFPSLGLEEGYVVVEGVGVADLRRGPGHYPGTALPGEVGNVVVSGHRTTYGAPFSAVGELRPGDPVVLETVDEIHTYRVTGLAVVPPTAIEVTYPVPGRAGVEPTQRLLTLTTCHPRYSARQRLVVTAELDETRSRSSPPAPA